MVQHKQTESNSEILHDSDSAQAKRKALKDLIIIGGVILFSWYLTAYVLSPIIPSWASDMDVETIRKMVMGELTPSAISLGAGLAAILATNESANIILKKRRIITAPEYTYVDLLDQKFVVESISP